MQHKTKAIKIISKTALIICNMCGKSFEPKPYVDNFISIKKTWGYGSPYDGETHSFELCEKCYDELLSRLEIKPE